MELRVPLERGAVTVKGLRGFRRRQRSRRLLICLVALCLIALSAAGLVWLLETFRAYSPSYYEPKDIERERHEMQQRSFDAKSRLQAP